MPRFWIGGIETRRAPEVRKCPDPITAERQHGEIARALCGSLSLFRSHLLCLSNCLFVCVERFIQLGLPANHVALIDQPARFLPKRTRIGADAAQRIFQLGDALLALVSRGL